MHQTKQLVQDSDLTKNAVHHTVKLKSSVLYSVGVKKRLALDH